MLACRPTCEVARHRTSLRRRGMAADLGLANPPLRHDTELMLTNRGVVLIGLVVLGLLSNVFSVQAQTPTLYFGPGIRVILLGRAVDQ